MRTLRTDTSLQERFEEGGYIVLPGALDPATVAGLREAARFAFERVVGTTIAERATHPRLTWWRLPDGRPYVFKIKPVADLAETFVEMASSPLLVDLATMLLGSRATLMEDKVTYKTALDIEAPWANLPVLGEEVRKHSDAAYFESRGFSRVLTVALCLDDCPAEAGALRVWPGSHRAIIEHVPTAEQGPVVPDESLPDFAAVTLTGEAGTVLAWDSALVHASGPNQTTKPRRLLVLGYTAGGH
ncbi:phytanoyl-CoA dioxygenase family protein [Actinoplanes sp. CA-051413]|uniref:phytanoyl-CoA dioxygenase family protein n=1 Tax=Actinoplanes sp. CA-051413 TaxID=3239899 RepID=UPI003D986DC4